MVIQIILLYLSFAAVDVMDKFLISKRKIQPLSYTFFTLATGALLLLAWPWVYQQLPNKFIILNLLSGAYFGLVMYFYFRLLSFKEVSRVVPVVFALVAVFDLILSAVLKRSVLNPVELGAMALIIPGILLVSYVPGKEFYKHLGLMVFTAFLYSSYNFFWQYGAQVGSSMNNLMWNRLGAALAVLVLLLIPLAKKNILTVNKVPKKQHTGFLFFAKQGLGGLNFVFLSYFLAKGKVPLVDGLSGFRYLFLFLLAIFFSHYHKNILKEEINKSTLKLKLIALVFIFSGTVILFAN